MDASQYRYNELGMLTDSGLSASWRGKLAVAAVSLLLASTAGWLWWRSREPVETVRLVDVRDDVVPLLRKRSEEAARRTSRAAGDGTEDGTGAESAVGLLREPIDEATARKLFPTLQGTRTTWDPDCFFRYLGPRRLPMKFGEHPAGTFPVVTNALGMREDDEPLAEPPDLRVLVTGDSHTDGVCPNEESFANVLEASLAARAPGRVVECLNAGTGGYGPYHYVGVFERLKHLAPDVFVVALYGGNDFADGLVLQRYFHRRPPAAFGPHKPRPLMENGGPFKSWAAQDLLQVTYFLNNPSDVAVAGEVACDVADELERQCAEVGTELICVYVPPPSRGQPHRFEVGLRAATEILGVDPEVDLVSDRIADAWLAHLAERGIAHLDLRPAFRETEEVLYWRSDLHLSTAGHRKVAELLEPLVAPLLEDAAAAR